MMQREYDLIARVLANTRYIDASAPIGSVTAMIAVDLGEAFKREVDPQFDAQRFHMLVQGQRPSGVR
jgi:hypothetical protein